MKVVQVTLMKRKTKLYEKLFRKREKSFTENELFGMSQVLGKAYKTHHKSFSGQTIYGRIVVSSVDIPTLGWKRNEIRKTIEFLRKEQLIKVYKQSLHIIDDQQKNVKYEIQISNKGAELASQGIQIDYFKERIRQEEKDRLEIQEKKANIRASTISLFSLVVSAISLGYSFYISSKGEKNEKVVTKLESKLDSIYKIYKSSKVLPVTLDKDTLIKNKNGRSKALLTQPK
ncbi:hypothetical protein ACFQ4C_13630 [Larkinella insperata]|uniref:Uncharacterized protein n=1 Tax=Larkinella insperata TaxID=332158 RepID=A0ABW3QBC5_9BACT|nr:hypothetical protein [Larkinella insperata]